MVNTKILMLIHNRTSAVAVAVGFAIYMHEVKKRDISFFSF
jgi:hypothetical protein